MKDVDTIKKQVETINNEQIAQNLSDIASRIFNNNVLNDDIATLYIALNQLKELNNIDSTLVKKCYNAQMRHIRENLCK